MILAHGDSRTRITCLTIPNAPVFSQPATFNATVPARLKRLHAPFEETNCPLCLFHGVRSELQRLAGAVLETLRLHVLIIIMATPYFSAEEGGGVQVRTSRVRFVL